VIDADRKPRPRGCAQTLFVPKQGESRANRCGRRGSTGGTTRARNKRLMPVSAVRAGEGDVARPPRGLPHRARAGAFGAIGDFGVEARLDRRAQAEGNPVAPRGSRVPTHAATRLVEDADATGTRDARAGTAVELTRPRRSRCTCGGAARVPTLHWIWAPWLGDALARDDRGVAARSLRARPRGRFGSMGRRGGAGGPRAPRAPRRARHRDGDRARAASCTTPRVGRARRDGRPTRIATPTARDLMVAQSDSGSAHLEVWTRAPAPRRAVASRRRAPQRRRGSRSRSTSARRSPGVAYLAWDATEPPRDPPKLARRAPPPTRSRGPTSAASSRLGLTYRDHVKERTGSKVEAQAGRVRQARPRPSATPTCSCPTARPLFAARRRGRARARARSLRERLPRAPGRDGLRGRARARRARRDRRSAALRRRARRSRFGLAARERPDRAARDPGRSARARGNSYDYWARAEELRQTSCRSRLAVWAAPPVASPRSPELDIETRVNGERRQKGVDHGACSTISPRIARAAGEAFFSAARLAPRAT